MEHNELFFSGKITKVYKQDLDTMPLYEQYAMEPVIVKVELLVSEDPQISVFKPTDQEEHQAINWVSATGAEGVIGFKII